MHPIGSKTTSFVAIWELNSSQVSSMLALIAPAVVNNSKLVATCVRLYLVIIREHGGCYHLRNLLLIKRKQ